MNYKHLQNGSDIRGVALEGIQDEPVTLTEQAVYDLARGFAKYLKNKTGKETLKVALGHDSRLSADALCHSIMDGLLFEGVHILDCGLASTPSLFMSTVFEEIQADGAIMVTASHLPWNRNGMKFFDKDGGLNKSDIETIIEHAENLDANSQAGGQQTKSNLMEIYATHLRTIIKEGVKAADYEQPLKGLHIVVDAGNGAGGFYATEVLAKLGADTTGSQFLDPDGHFPNHIPNPEDAKAMASICQAVKENHADLGIIFDTDVDRSSAVDHEGNPISRNAIVALAAILANKGHEGTTVVTDSVTSDELAEFLEKHGIHHHRFKRGYKNVINEAVRLNAEGIDTQLAIETSGHAALKENYFLDDGAYLATKIVIESAFGKVADLIADLKHPLEEKEVRFKIKADDFKVYGQSVLDAFKEYAKSKDYITPAETNHEGYRINFDEEHGNGWMLLRMSLHDPILPCNIESNTKDGTKQMAKDLYEFMKQFEQLDLSALENFIQ